MKPRVRRSSVPYVSIVGTVELWWDIYMGLSHVASTRSWCDAVFVANLIALNERGTT